MTALQSDSAPRHWITTMITRWEHSIQSKLKELEHGLHLQYRRIRELGAQLG